jgi:hypothetical protein
MQGREAFIDDLLHKIDSMISSIEERELLEEDLSIARELAEQLREEIESLDY